MTKQLLLCDLHIHTNLDPIHGPDVENDVMYSYQQAIDIAAKKGISVLAFTHHLRLIFTKEMASYAKKKGIVLLPSVEAVIEGCDVLLINTDTDDIHTFTQLRKLRKRNPKVLVIAPHPYYPASQCLGDKLEKNISLFDGIEFCHFYLPFYNGFNRKAIKIARKYNKPIIGTSDSHMLENIGRTHTVVKSEKDADAIITAIKKGDCATVTRQVPASYVFHFFLSVTRLARFLKKRE
ncbi:MAG TPA: PHP domain-containing protein [Acidobacteriota bacterium]|nr:PHP domain-containing protein [Acidobacteriota bacterium]